MQMVPWNLQNSQTRLMYVSDSISSWRGAGLEAKIEVQIVLWEEVPGCSGVGAGR